MAPSFSGLARFVQSPLDENAIEETWVANSWATAVSDPFSRLAAAELAELALNAGVRSLP